MHRPRRNAAQFSGRNRIGHDALASVRCVKSRPAVGAVGRGARRGRANGMMRPAGPRRKAGHPQLSVADHVGGALLAFGPRGIN